MHKAVILAVLSLLLGSCDLLRQTVPAAGAAAASGLSKPTLTFQGAALVEAPSQRMLEAYYCPQVVPDPFGLRGAAATACRQVFGPPPAVQDMRVSFDLRFKVSNPNSIPVPLAEILTAATVFPEQQAENLGAVCVKLCPSGDPSCNGGPDPNGCRESAGDIRTLDDFKQSAMNFLITQGLALAAGERPSFRAPEIATAQDLDVMVRFSFGPDALLRTMRQLAEQSVDRLKKGQEVSFEIPYRVEGTVWVDGGSLGRVAVGFGPVDGTWAIPTAALHLP